MPVERVGHRTWPPPATKGFMDMVCYRSAHPNDPMAPGDMEPPVASVSPSCWCRRAAPPGADSRPKLTAADGNPEA